MRLRIIELALVACVGTLAGGASAADFSIKSGVYEVNAAYVNLENCRVAGKPMDYASHYLKVTLLDSLEVKFQVSTCDGETLEDLSCAEKSNVSTLEQNGRGVFEGFRFNAHKSLAKDGTPQCLLTALRRSVVPMKGNFARYERADWGSLLADYSYECTPEMAQVYFQAQSLNCFSLIVIDAVRIDANSQRELAP